MRMRIFYSYVEDYVTVVMPYLLIPLFLLSVDLFQCFLYSCSVHTLIMPIEVLVSIASNKLYMMYKLNEGREQVHLMIFLYES